LTDCTHAVGGFISRKVLLSKNLHRKVPLLCKGPGKELHGETPFYENFKIENENLKHLNSFANV
jgi:hypothetical protein